MERLTRHTERGASLILDDPKSDAEAIAQVKANFLTALNRLAAYEDTELTPHQINLIQAATLAQQDELSAYRETGLTPERCAELAEAEREGRLVVTPRNPDIACTICGCVVTSSHRNRRLCDKCGSNVEKLRRHREKKKERKAALAAKEEA